MLNIRRLTHLAQSLGVDRTKLDEVLVDLEQHYEQLILIDPARPERQRRVVNVRKPLRTFQGRLYKRLLLKEILPSPHSHGGVTARSIKTNAMVHANSRYVLKTDISDFYPSIHFRRVYRLFVEEFGCSPDVARACTALTTHSHHLALGIVTSPILADQMLRKADTRIAAACLKLGLKYSRFVDDITISGDFDFAGSGVQSTISRILKSEGFVVNQKKCVTGPIEETPITGIQIHRSGRFDVTREYADALRTLLEEAKKLSLGEDLDRPLYFTRSQILGRIQFAGWVNSVRKKPLLRAYKRVDWKSYMRHAIQKGYVRRIKILRKADTDGEPNVDDRPSE